MTATTVEQELLELEKEYWQAMKRNDVDAALRMTTDPCIVAGASGVSSIDHATFKKMMTGAPWKINKFEIKDGAQVQRLTDDVAVVAYQVHEDMTVDGKPVSMDAADVSIWVRQKGRWLCAVHTESVAGDPYGQDGAKPK
jgi:ketosteroid isomerase-like protein